MSADDRAAIARLPGFFPTRWLRGYARGKLRSDPVYQASWERIGGSQLPLLDIGCGIGLLAFYLRERGFAAPILGFDVDAKKVAVGQSVASRYPAVTVQTGDADSLPKWAGNVSLLDVLHYLPQATQSTVLAGMPGRIAPGGWCIIRTTPRDTSWRFRATQIQEWLTGATPWVARPVVTFPALESIASNFPETDFARETRPLWGRTPFNSWLLAFRRK